MESPSSANPRSAACNGDLLISLRERKGWTQQQLAAAAGYSERLITKAESGKPISTAAIDVLAETLSTDDDPIYSEDLTCDTIALSREFMAALYIHQKDIVDALARFLHEEIVVRVAGNPEVLPFAGEHRGLAAVRRAFDIFYSVLEAPRELDDAKYHNYLAQGKDVMVWGHSWLHPIGMPMTQPMPITHRFRYQKGKLVLFEDVFDTLQGARVLGSEPLG